MKHPSLSLGPRAQISSLLTLGVDIVYEIARAS